MRRLLTTLTFSSQQQVRCLSIRLLAPALMRATVAAIVGADIAPTCVAAESLVIVHQLRLAFNFCAFNICAPLFSYAFPVRYEEGGGIWPHTDVADNEITLTLQLQVKSPPPRLSLPACASLHATANTRWWFVAAACALEQWQQRCCAHGRQRRRALLRQQAGALARLDARALLRHADDIRVEALQ